MAAEPAAASLPLGIDHGAWHVSSTSSLSGASGDDASVVMTQGVDPNMVQLRWTQGGPVHVSIMVDGCTNDGRFEAGYAVETRRWLRLSLRSVQRRLRADISTWLDQVKLACPVASAGGTFRWTGLNAAIADFDHRLRYFVQDEQMPDGAE